MYLGWIKYINGRPMGPLGCGSGWVSPLHLTFEVCARRGKGGKGGRDLVGCVHLILVQN